MASRAPLPIGMAVARQGLRLPGQRPLAIHRAAGKRFTANGFAVDGLSCDETVVRAALTPGAAAAVGFRLLDDLCLGHPSNNPSESRLLETVEFSSGGGWRLTLVVRSRGR